MKKLFIGIALFYGLSTHAQTLKSSADCSMSLVVSSYDGNNGLGVTYNPSKKEYYTAFAGNESYPLEGYNAAGELLFSTTLGVDARGFWYNTKSKKIEGFGYANSGWYTIALTGKGSDIQTATSYDNNENTFGLGEQCVGSYMEKEKSVFFVENQTAYVFEKQGEPATKQVALQYRTDAGYLNEISPIYTGVKGKEIGLLNYETMTMEFYSITSGNFTGSVELNYGNCQEEIDFPYSFRVSYANKKVWIYDTYSRSWLGFDIWK